MNIGIKDIIILSDDNEYVVVSKAKYQNNAYYYLIDKNNNENLKFCIEKTESKSFLEIEDADLIQKLLPLFLDASSKAITKEDLEIIGQ